MRPYILTLILLSLQPARADSGDIERFAYNFRKSPQAVLVCIYKEWQGDPVDWDCEGTVVQSLKGNWKVGDRIHFYVALEPGTKMTPRTYTSDIGRLKYLFLDTYSKDKVILQTGESALYTRELSEAATNLLKHREAEPFAAP